MPLWRWSRTANSNSNADPSIGMAEGMAPSAVNDGVRALMAAVAMYRDDISGAIVTGGTSTALTVTSFSVYDSLAHLDGQVIAFSPHTTSGATVTLSVDGLTAKPLRSAPGVELPAGVLIQGTPYTALYSNSDGAFYLEGFYGQPYSIPIGGLIDYTGSTTPNSSFVFPTGQAISRTTYAAYFAIVGTTYGSGDGSTTFNVPDLTGRVVAMKEASATRLTSTYFGGNSANLGAVGGAEKETLLTANLPPYTPAGSVSNGAISITGSAAAVNGSTTGGGGFNCGGGTASLGASQGTSTFTGTAQGGTSTPVVTVQPTIVLNKILRII